ncbi:enoyl-CoA hydratase/isomerase family protein, partial [Mycolicibacterium insubricum]|uniref:enoyl-CoA hydratase/isomerase family protein n=1 Tax=Mycolicibacterium insubricum TaxID=444597 RepID=UPI0021F35BA9
MLEIADENRVRTLTLDRPEALNASTSALRRNHRRAAGGRRRPEVAVVLLTGAGRAFSAGTDLGDLQAMATDPDFIPGEFGFNG